MRKYCKGLLIFLLVALLTILNTSCYSKKAEGISSIFLVNSKSYFSDFTVQGENVYIKCQITLKSTKDKECKICLTAYLPEDVRGGLLKSEELPAVDRNNKKKIFTIKPNSEKEYDVAFLGKFAGAKIKQNRLLPEIEIEDII